MFGKVIVSLALTLACVYFLVLVWLLLGLFKIKRNTKRSAHGPSQVAECEGKPLFVSVIVAARNEEENLARCLKSLLDQTYPKELYEVILVDDNSTDNSVSIARSFARKDDRVKLLSTKKYHNLTGKQHALDTGIRASKGRIILTTDADCKPPPRWIEDTVREFDPDVGLVAGYSVFEENGSELFEKKLEQKFRSSLFQRLADDGILQRTFTELQLLELLSQYIFSIGSMSQGVAWTCTGNNLAYRREVYDELGGYETLGLTGLEDNMMLQWVGKNSKWKVKPVCNVVYTKPVRTVSRFFAQRIRWASSSLQYRLPLVAFLVVAYGLNLALPFLIGLSVLGIISYKEFIVFLSLKIVPEFLLVLKGLTLFNKTGLIKYFPLAQPLHVMYILICGIHGLSGKFAWRGRKYREVETEEGIQSAE